MRRLLVVPAIALGLLASSAVGLAQQSALAGDGTLYRGLAGTYGALFPHGHAVPGTQSVLAIEKTASDGSVSRLLVRGSEDPGVDDPPTLYFDNGSGHLFVLWSSTHNQIFSTLQLVELGPDGWTEPAEVSGNPFGEKQGLSVLVTRDRADLIATDGTPSPVERTIAHVVWWEDGGEYGHILYVPVASVNGHYVGWSPSIDLAELDPSLAGTALPSYAPFQQPQLQRGRGPQQVVAGFASPRTGRLVTIELTVEPIALRLLVDSIYAEARALFADPEATPAAIGDSVRAHIIRLGSMFHPSVSGYLGLEAGAFATQLAEVRGNRTPAALAAEVRAHIIRLGVTTLGNQILRDVPTPTWAIEPTIQNDALDAYLLLGAVRAGNRELPDLAVDAPIIVFHSPSGRNSIYAWDLGQSIRYVVSSGDGWSAAQQLHVNATLDRSGALELLAVDARALD